MSEEEYLDDEKVEVPRSLEQKKIPRFLKWAYILLPIWGLIWFYLFWNGSRGCLDGGCWQKLQEAANTIYISKEKE
ncbi:MAG: hypothetical protein P4L16_08180 [Chlamydiales bacterium]|nr:hypothetical protein [Chlamydiales bacterium]